MQNQRAGQGTNLARQYQSEVADELKQIFPESEVKTEWRAMSTEKNIYCPRVDIAIGPFATTTTCINEYNDMMCTHRQFLNEIIGFHIQNLGINGSINPEQFLFNYLNIHNQNSRCFIAIEIENKVNRKHFMGSAINASVLGRIGIIIGWNQDKLNAFVRMKRYFGFLFAHNKSTIDPVNLLILERNQLSRSIRSSLMSR